jgi:hypothetical protein
MLGSATGTVASGNTIFTAPGADNFAPQLGFHFVQAMEFAVGGTSTYDGATNMRLSIDLEM